jgi:hypothetical protein
MHSKVKERTESYQEVTSCSQQKRHLEIFTTQGAHLLNYSLLCWMDMSFILNTYNINQNYDLT